LTAFLVGSPLVAVVLAAIIFIVSIAKGDHILQMFPQSKDRIALQQLLHAIYPCEPPQQQQQQQQQQKQEQQQQFRYS